MKSFINKLAIIPVLGLVLAAACLMNQGNVSAIVDSSWGPEDRATYSWDKPADHVTFNSITDNPNIGDERNFVRIRKVGDTGYNTDVLDVEVGEEYEVFMYYHNNASASLNSSGKGIARDVYMRTEFPKYIEAGQTAAITGFINSSNATPTEIWDTAFLRTNTPVYLNYVVNSAVIHNGGTSDGVGMSGDALLSEKGATLSYWNDLWGMVPGCNEYAGYVTYRIKIDQPDFSVDKQVALAEIPDSYKDEITVLPGDVLNFKIMFKNTGTTEQTAVTFHDLLPNGLSYVEGSATWGSTRHPQNPSAQGDLFGDGIGIGAIIAGEEAWVSYQAKITDSEAIFPCGETTIYNGALVATHSGQSSDKVTITVKRTCGEPSDPTPSNPTPTNPTPSSLPTTGPAEIIMVVAIFLVIGGGSFYLYRSRKMLRKVSSAVNGDEKADNIVLSGIKNSPIKEEKHDTPKDEKNEHSVKSEKAEKEAEKTEK